MSPSNLLLGPFPDERRRLGHKHMRTYSGEKRYKRTHANCEAAFAQSGNLTRHMRTHTGEKPYKCTYDNCEAAFAVSFTLTTHMRTHSGEKRYKCTHGNCEAAFAQSGNLTRHMRTHTGEKPYKCTYANCEVAFAVSCALTSHMRTHSGEKPYRCTYANCEADFARSSELTTHMRRHTGEKPYKCTCANCESTFVRSSDLTTHMRTHSGEKPYKCTYANCETAFARSSDLTKHMRTHTGEKTYKCTYANCKAAFTTSGTLTIHMRTHSGEKPYKCTYANCETAFARSGDLTTHIRTHTGEKPYHCDHCPKQFAQLGHSKQHLKWHEEQKKLPHVCKMQDGGTQLWQEGFVKCSIRTKHLRDMDVHIQRNHTIEGIASKLQSENKLAQFFDSQDIVYDRDWVNRISFKTCQNIEGGKHYARPDFYLPVESARLNSVVLVGNDEFAHRQYPCDFQRTWNIVQALEQSTEFKGVPIVYVRFNPHAYYRGKVLFDTRLCIGHELVLRTLRGLETPDLKPGLNLIYIHYDMDEAGELCLFNDNSSDNDHNTNDFAPILRDCVLLSK